VGLSFDLMLYNLMGFSFLAVYNAFMLWDPTTREQYSDRNNGGTPQVAENDFAFAAHATTLMTVYFVQVAIFDVRRTLGSTAFLLSDAKALLEGQPKVLLACHHDIRLPPPGCPDLFRDRSRGGGRDPRPSVLPLLRQAVSHVHQVLSSGMLFFFLFFFFVCLRHSPTLTIGHYELATTINRGFQHLQRDTRFSRELALPGTTFH